MERRPPTRDESGTNKSKDAIASRSRVLCARERQERRPGCRARGATIRRRSTRRARASTHTATVDARARARDLRAHFCAFVFARRKRENAVARARRAPRTRRAPHRARGPWTRIVVAIAVARRRATDAGVASAREVRVAYSRVGRARGRARTGARRRSSGRKRRSRGSRRFVLVTFW